MPSYHSSVYGSSAHTGGGDYPDSSYNPPFSIASSGYSGDNQTPPYTPSRASYEGSSLAVPNGYSEARHSGAREGLFREPRPLDKNGTHYPTPYLARPSHDRRAPISDMHVPCDSVAAMYAGAAPLTASSILSGLGSFAWELGSNCIEAGSNYWNGKGFRPDPPLGVLDAEYGEDGSNPYYVPSPHEDMPRPGRAAQAANDFIKRTEYPPKS